MARKSLIGSAGLPPGGHLPAPEDVAAGVPVQEPTRPRELRPFPGPVLAARHERDLIAREVYPEVIRLRGDEAFRQGIPKSALADEAYEYADALIAAAKARP